MHSDQGYEYTSKTFKLKLDNVSATQSMSRVGRCIDNGPIEGFVSGKIKLPRKGKINSPHIYQYYL